ncbi:MAG: 50S ribosomal protein L28 [Deltaproteobacteria bacterium RIFCSPHIGHO2_02_FULL_40_11]|nr:MAG: 50S ribosomal protein L28 [Deltaproteobacteria bacterium RIFCSPHIGHO2_02_FULL_40_11]
MAQVCEFTGIRPLKGNQVSHANNKTRTRQNPNMRSKRFFIPELNRTVRVRVTSNAMRTIDKLGGFSQALLRGNSKNFSHKLQLLRKALQN